MSHLESGAIRFGAHLLQSTVSSALALSALAGGVMLSGGEAKAVICWGPGTFPASTVTCSAGNFTLDWMAGPNGGFGDIELEDLVPGVTGDEAKADVDWTPSLTTGAGTYQYSLTHDLHPFIESSLVIVANPLATNPNFTATKLIYDNSSFTGPALATITVNQDNPQGMATYISTKNQIWVQVDYSGTEIDNIVDYHQVPGSLPLLGASAAFGFSRKLRCRIKASRGA